MPALHAQLIRYDPGRRMAPHADGCRRLSVLVAGELRESDRDRHEHATVGSVALKAPGFVHRNRFGDQGTTIISAILPDALVRRLGFAPNALDTWRWHHRGAPSLAALQLAIQLRRGDAEAAMTCLRGLLSAFSLADESPAASPIARRIRERLHGSPGDPMDVRALAEEEAVHPVSLGRIFRRAFGCSITRYRQGLRVTAAARALIGGERLVDVALDHGFSDSSHMSRVFRRELGVPPGAFRDELGPSGVGLESSKTEWRLSV